MKVTSRNLQYAFTLGVILLGRTGVANQDPNLFDMVPVCKRSPLVIEQLEHNAKKACNQITALDLSRLDNFQIGFNPNLVEVKQGDLRGLMSVEYLYFNCNPNLASVPEDLIRGMENLETLAIHTNPKLTSFPEGIFSDLKESTRVVMIMSNGLTSLPESFFAHFAKRKTPFTLYLRGNPFTPETIQRILDAFDVELEADGRLPFIIKG